MSLIQHKIGAKLSNRDTIFQNFCL